MLPDINLLPWRDLRKQQIRQHFFVTLAVYAVVTFGMVSAAWFWVSSHHNAQSDRNALIQREINQLQTRLTQFSRVDGQREVLESKIALVDSLQQQRRNVVSVFNLLPKIVPQGALLDTVDYRAGYVVITGKAKSNALVSELLENLETNSDIDQEKVHSIDRDDDEVLLPFRFHITFYLKTFVSPELALEESTNG
ncbi:hypothetical protein CS022_09410 [Veronia nyctiphanis]|uniref:Uncharacterized protein n=1 Tax=Veronia nyctiphanis TaxID=1278244 RepID=A0A4Q0YQW1_9GAMM|nr:PilN domain-containing protein [Veronia nyctiphanis]RXJ73456.1 hypothetical protein CS022_09410 [Veronia nyctiphanis]